MKVYHGSNENKDFLKVKNSGVFCGLFASVDRSVAESHGAFIYTIELDSNSIADSNSIDVDVALESIKILSSDENEISTLYDAIVFDSSLFECDIEESRLCEIFSCDYIGEADWTAQKIRGEIAAKMGFAAIEMRDEHGISYLVLPNNTFNKI